MRLGKVVRFEEVSRKISKLSEDGSIVTTDEPSRLYGYLVDNDKPTIEIAFNPLKMKDTPQLGETVGFLIDKRNTDKLRAYKVFHKSEINNL